MSGVKIRKSQILQPFGVGAIIEAEGRSYVVKPTTSWKTEDMYDISIGSLAGRIPSIQKILTPKKRRQLFTSPVPKRPGDSLQTLQATGGAPQEGPSPSCRSRHLQP